MSYPLNTFYREYIDQLDQKAIKRYCKHCDHNWECSNDGIPNDPLLRFGECDILQETF